MDVNVGWKVLELVETFLKESNEPIVLWIHVLVGFAPPIELLNDHSFDERTVVLISPTGGHLTL